MAALSAWDPEVADAIHNENERQRRSIVLIASENYTSRGVLEAQATVMNNKYAEGYPGRRYYGGCQYVDVVEQLAIDRAKSLYNADHANVQPHSGAQANMAAYFALLEPGDTVMGMRLDQGGHLTHGSPVNFSGKLYNFVAYGVSQDTETIDYEEVERLAEEHRPKLIVAGYTAYPRTIDFERFRRIANGVGGHPDGRHGPHRRPDRRQRSSTLSALRRCSDLHHPEDLARSTGRLDTVRRKVPPEDRPGGVSFHPGRPFYACHSRKSGMLR